MEVACCLDDFAQVLAEDGYINFNDAADLPSMFRAFESNAKNGLDSPESFPESPCSDEDIARVLEITQMSSPSILESCISDSFVALPTSHNDSGLLEHSRHQLLNATKTRDPCITNAVLHDVFRSTTTSTIASGSTQFSPCRSNSAPSLDDDGDGVFLSSNLFNNSVSVNLNHFIDAKENDLLSTSYFNSATPLISPISEIDHINIIQHTPPPDFSDDSHGIENDPSSMVGDDDEVIPSETNLESLSINYENQVKQGQQKRKRKRKGYSRPKASKSKKAKNKSANNSNSSLPNEPKQQSKPKKAKLSQDIPSDNRKKSKSQQSLDLDLNNKNNTITETIPDSRDNILTLTTDADSVQSKDISTVVTSAVDIPTAKDGTPLRRSSRASKNPENYNFRVSSLVKRVETERRQKEPKQPKGKAKPPPLSKYRRRTANARERDRMKDINDAYDALKDVLPAVEDESKQKMTKFSILKLTLNYISALSDMLGYDIPQGHSPSTSSPGEDNLEGSSSNSYLDSFNLDSMVSMADDSFSSSSDNLYPSPSSESSSEHNTDIPMANKMETGAERETACNRQSAVPDASQIASCSSSTTDAFSSSAGTSWNAPVF